MRMMMMMMTENLHDQIASKDNSILIINAKY